MKSRHQHGLGSMAARIFSHTLNKFTAQAEQMKGGASRSGIMKRRWNDIFDSV
jgi:hypothetical protein